jgi:hypothetical protein
MATTPWKVGSGLAWEKLSRNSSSNYRWLSSKYLGSNRNPTALEATPGLLSYGDLHYEKISIQD